MVIGSVLALASFRSMPVGMVCGSPVAARRSTVRASVGLQSRLALTVTSTFSPPFRVPVACPVAVHMRPCASFLASSGLPHSTGRLVPSDRTRFFGASFGWLVFGSSW